MNRLIGSTAVLAVALVLAACSGGGSDDGSTSADEGDAASGGTLTYASWQWQEPARGEQLWAAVSAYMDENPEATLEKQETTRADYEKTISTQIGAGGGPDIMIVPDAFFASLASSGALEPLDDVLADEDQAALVESNEDYQFEDQQLSLAWERVPYALIWNQQVIDEAGVELPTNYDELVTAAQTIQATTGKTGFVTRHLLNEEGPWWTGYSNYSYGFGGAWSDGESLTINSPENVAGAEAMKEMYDSGAFGGGDDASTYRSKFAAGEVGFILDNAAAVYTMVADNDVVPSTDVGAMVLPFPTGMSASANFSIGINANSENKALAKDFIRWMYTESTQQSLAAALFPSGVGTDVDVPQETIDANPWFEGFREQSENTRNVVIDGFEEQTPQISHVILTKVQEMLTTDLSPQDALDAAQAEAEALVG